jgi:hypothetical protein
MESTYMLRNHPRERADMDSRPIPKVHEVYLNFVARAATAELAFIEARELVRELWNGDSSGQFPEKGFLVLNGGSRFIDLIEPKKDEQIIAWNFSWCYPG